MSSSVFHVLVLVVVFATCAWGHAVLKYPHPWVRRGWMICGSNEDQWNTINKGRCGVCGEEYIKQRENKEKGIGPRRSGVFTKWSKGQVITARVFVSQAHQGYFTFYLCEQNRPGVYPKESCFQKNKLRLVDEPGTKWYLGDRFNDTNEIRLKLPDDLECWHCVFRWIYKTAHAGYGDRQEHFYACADVKIGNIPSPRTLPPTTAGPKEPITEIITRKCRPVPPYPESNQDWCDRHCNPYSEDQACPSTHCKCEIEEEDC